MEEIREIKGIIFDLDGVIVSTDHYHYLAWKALADKQGIYFDEEINNRLRGVSRLESLNIILEKYNGDELSEKRKLELCEEKNQIYRKLLGNMSGNDVSDDVRYTLDILKNKGYKLAIGSSSKNAKFILNKIGLFDKFDAISDGTNIINSKPDPEVFLKACSFLNLFTRNCLVVEDAKAGIDAAHNVGMLSAGIGEAANYSLSTYKLNKISDLIEVLS